MISGSTKFLSGIFVILLLYTATIILITSNSDISVQQQTSFIYAAILTTLNIIAVFLIIKLNFNKDVHTFNRTFFLGFGIRFIILLILIFLVLLFGRVNQFTFLVSLFILYFIFQFWEIFFLNRNFKQESVDL